MEGKFARPLAERMRPKELSQIVGQEHLLSPNGLIGRAIANKRPLSILLWGPPGCGKTTIARLYAQAFGLHFQAISAVFSGVGDIKKAVSQAEATPLWNQGSLLFVDEIHRFNKAQQDAFLPYIENGTLILVGATTENPSFSLNNALLSRLRVLPLKPLDEKALATLLQRYEKLMGPLPLKLEARQLLLAWAQGDGRYLLNLIENIEQLLLSQMGPFPLLAQEEVALLLQRKAPLFDRQSDEHYNLISALHKSIRGSDPDAALYWLARMLIGGEDPLYLTRRLIRMAIEDIGLADPEALKVALQAESAFKSLGPPEGELALAQAAVYLALAPKSNALYKAFKAAKKNAEQSAHLPPPKEILNPSTSLMKELNYGQGYLYDHDEPFAFSGQNYFPNSWQRQRYYEPVERGFEREMKKRIAYFDQLRQKKGLE